MDVRYRAVSKSFGGVEALIGLDLDVPDGTFLALLGPSGCGKTTALRILAGLEEPTAGSVFIGEQDVTRLQPKDRDVAMVFQSYALYPHKNVAENIGYPLRVRKVDKGERSRRVRQVAELLSIERLLDRTPRQLSGGQRQRVALARAIVREPRAFLMDEPLSNLDAQLRLQMRVEIKRLQKQLGVTTLYVTHDQVEAMTMADLVAVMRDGVLQQLAPPAKLYAHPANLFVARFCGSPPMNVLAGDVSEGAFRHPKGVVPLAGGPPARPAMLGFRPEHVRLVEPGAAGSLDGEVYVVEPLGNETLVAVKVGDEILNVRVAAGYDAPIGRRCGVSPTPGHLHLFDPQSEASISDTQAAGSPAPAPGGAPSPSSQSAGSDGRSVA
jgi:multiple sugar transport system ATP-binding protein